MALGVPVEQMLHHRSRVDRLRCTNDGPRGAVALEVALLGKDLQQPGEQPSMLLEHTERIGQGLDLEHIAGAQGTAGGAKTLDDVRRTDGIELRVQLVVNGSAMLRVQVGEPRRHGRGDRRRFAHTSADINRVALPRKVVQPLAPFLAGR